MSLFKHAMVSGINDALVDRGLVSWPDERVGFEVCAKLAADLDGPEILPEGDLAKESALLIGQHIKAASDTLIANGYSPSASTVLRTKQAAQLDFADRAAYMAEACMTKAAEEASLTPVGKNTPESAAHDDQHAKLDQQNRATNKYLRGVGKTQFPNGGVVGQQMVAPERQSGPAISNSLTALDKQAANIPMPTNTTSLLNRIRNAATQQFLPEARAILQAEGLRKAAPMIGHELIRDPRAQAAAGALALGGGGLGLHHALSSNPAEVPPEAHLASEDMSAADLSDGTDPELAAAGDMTPGATPGALARAMMFLRAMGHKIPGFRPGPEAQVAAGGLGEAGQPGMEVMGELIENIKTASEADDIIAQILHHQGQAGQLASPELIAAIEQLMAEEGGGEQGQGMLAAPPEGAPMAAPEGMKTAGKKFDTLKEFTRKGIEAAKRGGKAVGSATVRGGKAVGSAAVRGGKAVGGAAKTVGEHVKEHKTPYALGAAGIGGIGIGAGGMAAIKGHGKKEEGEEPTESKAASLLAQLKAAADGGSLTDVGANTPESAAKDDQFAELDQKNRATAEYLIGQGGISALPNKGQIYAVEKAPKHDAVATPNTPTEETKNAEEKTYVENFRKIASELGPYLPATMARETKIAHLQTMLGLPPSERPGYLKALRAS